MKNGNKNLKEENTSQLKIIDIPSTTHDNDSPPTQICRTSQDRHCVRGVRIWSYAGQHFTEFGLNSV